MGGIIRDAKYEEWTGKTEYTEDEYRQVRQQYPDIERQLSVAAEAARELKWRKTTEDQIAAAEQRMLDIDDIVKFTPQTLEEADRKVELLSEKAGLDDSVKVNKRRLGIAY